MSAWLKDAEKKGYPTTRSGKMYLSQEEVERIEKSLYLMSPDIIRYNKQKDKEFRSKGHEVPTHNKQMKKREKIVKQVLSPLVETIHWLDYNEKKTI